MSSTLGSSTGALLTPRPTSIPRSRSARSGRSSRRGRSGPNSCQSRAASTASTRPPQRCRGPAWFASARGGGAGSGPDLAGLSHFEGLAWWLGPCRLSSHTGSRTRPTVPFRAQKWDSSKPCFFLCAITYFPAGHAADRSAPARLALRLSLQSAGPRARRKQGWIGGPLFHLRFR